MLIIIACPLFQKVRRNDEDTHLHTQHSKSWWVGIAVNEPQTLAGSQIPVCDLWIGQRSLLFIIFVKLLCAETVTLPNLLTQFLKTILVCGSTTLLKDLIAWVQVYVIYCCTINAQLWEPIRTKNNTLYLFLCKVGDVCY